MFQLVRYGANYDADSQPRPLDSKRQTVRAHAQPSNFTVARRWHLIALTGMVWSRWY